jgi:NAD(P)H dehydrogenase (quinone)
MVRPERGGAFAGKGDRPRRAGGLSRSGHIGKARWSWVDIEDVSAVAAACLLDPEKHHGQTYRLGYEAATYDEIATIFTEVIGQPFSYEARSPEEFYRNVLAAGAEPAYMKCVFDSFHSLVSVEGGSAA